MKPSELSEPKVNPLMKSKIIKNLSILLICCVYSSIILAQNKLLDPSQNPSKQDWLFLVNASPEVLEKLWREPKKPVLTSWHWKWRLGFLQACSKKALDNCQEIIEQGLRDKAAVVRGQAALTLAEVSLPADAKNLTLLKEVAASSQNYRNGKPLFVLYHILDAIKRIGGPASVTILKEMSIKNPKIRAYLQKS